MRYFIELSYHGAAFHGWQRQPNAATVQEAIENALSTVLRRPIDILGAGRTDAGVHATQMIAHVDLDPEELMVGTSTLAQKLNAFLNQHIAILNLYQVKDDAHARFDAHARAYEYHIHLGKSPFVADRAYTLFQQPNVTLMNQAAQLLLGHQDFQCFSRSNTDVKTYFCDIRRCEWVQEGNTLIFHIEADRFLRNMVRAVVGTLLEIGFGKRNIENIPDLIASKQRSNAGASVPGHGLFLTKVAYPENIKL